MTIGDGAYTAAGSVITDDVPPGAMGVGRAQQRNIEGWVERKRPDSAAAPAARRAEDAEMHGRRQWTDDFPVRRRAREQTSDGHQDHAARRPCCSSPAGPIRRWPTRSRSSSSSASARRMIREFPNGEIYARPEESVRGCDAFVIQAFGPPINKWIMEQLIMVDALKRASAKRITVVMPFYPYARQDKKHLGREPISARLMADLFKVAGADRLMSVDLHTAQIQGFFDGPVDHLFALPLLADYITDRYDTAELHRGLPGHRPGADGRALGRPARRRAGGVRPQDPRPQGRQRGRRPPRRR